MYLLRYRSSSMIVCMHNSSNSSPTMALLAVASHIHVPVFDLWVLIVCMRCAELWQHIGRRAIDQCKALADACITHVRNGGLVCMFEQVSLSSPAIHSALYLTDFGPVLAACVAHEDSEWEICSLKAMPITLYASARNHRCLCFKCNFGNQLHRDRNQS